MDFKERIRTRRLELGLTLDEVAKIVGVSNATISRWESGAIENQRRDKVELLAKALRISPGELMGWGDQDAPEKTPAVRVDDELDPAIADLILQYRAASPQQQRAAVAAALAVLKSR